MTQCRYPGAEGRDSLKKNKRTSEDKKLTLDRRRIKDHVEAGNELKFAGVMHG